jgi:hypothetical protein
MDDIFSRLTKLSAQLNADSDSISEALKQIETKLGKLRLGIEEWIVLSKDKFEGDTITTDLGYAKINGTWHLAIRDDINYVNTGSSEGDEPMALQQASRELRYEALKRMPVLIKALEDKAEQEVRKLQSALALAKEL